MLYRINMVLAYTVSREKCLIDRLEGVLDDDEPQMNPRMDRGGREQRLNNLAKLPMKQFRQIFRRPLPTCWERELFYWLFELRTFSSSLSLWLHNLLSRCMALYLPINVGR